MTKAGVPVGMNAAILLKRQDHEEFQSIITTRAQECWGFPPMSIIYRSDPTPDAIIFNPATEPTTSALDVLNLGQVELETLWGITITNDALGDRSRDQAL